MCCTSVLTFYVSVLCCKQPRHQRHSAPLLAAVLPTYGTADFPGLSQVGGGRSGRLSEPRSARTLPAAALHRGCTLQPGLNKHAAVCAVLQRPRPQTPLPAAAGRQVLRHAAVPAAVRPEAAGADVPGLPRRKPQQVPSCALWRRHDGAPACRAPRAPQLLRGTTGQSPVAGRRRRRLEHSMGVAHLAWTLATRIKQFQGAELGWSQREYESDSKVIQLAGGSPCLTDAARPGPHAPCSSWVQPCACTACSKVCVAPAGRVPADDSVRSGPQASATTWGMVPSHTSLSMSSCGGKASSAGERCYPWLLTCIAAAPAPYTAAAKNVRGLGSRKAACTAAGCACAPSQECNGCTMESGSQEPRGHVRAAV